MSKWDNETAEWYAQHYGEYPTNRLAIEALTLPAKADVVDVGCGTGAALRHAAQYVTEGKLIGIDPVPRMVEIAKAHTQAHAAAARITYLQGAAESLPLKNACADVVLAFDSFDHWVDRAKGLAEVYRILRRDGVFVIVKDGGLPGGADARQRFVDALEVGRFSIASEREMKEGSVSFTLWACVMQKASAS
ncbi:MAG: class I SAM-dependent methyltransferase [Bacteroidota bacterium]